MLRLSLCANSKEPTTVVRKLTAYQRPRYPSGARVPIILPMRLRLTLEGMLAVHAKRAVFTALAGVPGVTNAEVDMGSATIDCEHQVSEATLRAALDTVGVRLTATVRELPTL